MFNNNILISVKRFCLLLLFILLFTTQISSQESSGLGKTLRAQIQPVHHSVLSAEMTGRIISLPLKEGNYFTKNDTIAVFDCSLEKARLKKANSSLMLAEKKLQVQQRLKELGATSSVKIAVAEAEVEEAKAQKKIERVKVERCYVKAPFRGRVSELYVNCYQSVKQGEKLIKLVNTDKLEAELIVPSLWQNWVKPGKEFKITIDETKKTYEMIVDRTGPWIDPVSQSFEVYARFKEVYPELKPGMSGKAFFNKN